MAFSRGAARAPPLVVTLLSFGFKHGVPVEADLVFDVRFLPNPHFVPALRRRTGRDRAVVALHGAARRHPRVPATGSSTSCGSSSRTTWTKGRAT